MHIPRLKTRYLIALALVSLMVAAEAGQRGRSRGREGPNGRMRSSHEMAETKIATERENAYRKQEQEALKKRLGAMKKHAAAARKTATTNQATMRREGKGNVLPTFQQNCATCHTYPDPRYPTDQVWLRRVGVTSCTGTPIRARTNLANYLSGVVGLQPRTITSNAIPTASQVAVVTNLKNGEIFLKSAAGVTYRLAWDGESPGESRVLPAGNYTLFGYRLIDGPWIIAATGGNAPLMLAPGRPRSIEIDTSIKVDFQSERRGDNIALNLALTGAGGMGVGIYRGGYAAPITYVVERRSGVVGQGTLSLLGAGKSNALMKPLEGGEPGRATVELPASLPVVVKGNLVAPVPAAPVADAPPQRQRPRANAQ